MLNLLPQRLKQIRTEYQIPITEVPMLCASVKKSALNTWEAGTRMPPIDCVYEIALAFGVSIDWLVGLSTERYTEQSVSAAEEAFPVSADTLTDMLSDYVSERILQAPGVTVESLADSIQHYADPVSRRQHWSLPARAGIVILVRHTQNLVAKLDFPIDTPLTISQNRRLSDYRAFLLWSVAKGKAPTE